jgi:hypothetical protein
MQKIFEEVSKEALVTTCMSAVSIILGAIIGAICSWIINKNSICRTEKLQSKLAEDERKLKKEVVLKKVYENAAIIRLDICTAMYQTIRNLKRNKNDYNNIIPLPINLNYSSSVALLEQYFELKELSYIYQLYGIIEKLNYDIKRFGFSSEEYKFIIKDCELFISKLYGENYEKILEVDIDNVRFEELYNNSFIKAGYKGVLEKLDRICKQRSSLSS